MQNPKNEPSKEVLELSSDQIDQMWKDAKASMQGHSWMQQGTEVYCESCPFRHSFYVEPGYVLKGIDESGNPLIDKIF